jgi:hypothetical protein
MFDLDYIVALNNKVARDVLASKRPAKGSNQELVKTLSAFLSIDLLVNDYAQALRTCEEMLEVAFRVAPLAIEGLQRKGEPHAVEK